MTDPTATTAVLRVEFVGVSAQTAPPPSSEILAREKAEITSPRRARRPRSRAATFEPDSMSAHGLAWSGFRVHVRTGDKEGDVRRWVALHPDFPHRRRAYVVALDEQTLPKARPVPRGAAAAALARSLEPTGVGLAGGLVDAYLDARVVDVRGAHRHHDAPVLAAPGRRRCAHAFLGVGARPRRRRRLLPVRGDRCPPDSLVDPASPDYGVGFDRNGDGKIDLHRAEPRHRGGTRRPRAADRGRARGRRFRRPDRRLDRSRTATPTGTAAPTTGCCVLDTNHDGRPDRAVRFTDDLSDHANRSLSIKDGVVEDTLVGSKVGRLDFAESWRDGDRLLARWNRVRAACGP